jgi:hypothetical protein
LPYLPRVQLIVGSSHFQVKPRTKVGSYFFSTKHVTLRVRAMTGWFRIRIMCQEWSNMSTCRLLFQWASTIKIQQSRRRHHLLQYNLFSPWKSWKIAYLALNNNQQLLCVYIYIYILTFQGIGCYMFRIDDTDVVDATLHGSAARFINHSCEVTVLTFSSILL